MLNALLNFSEDLEEQDFKKSRMSEVEGSEEQLSLHPRRNQTEGSASVDQSTVGVGSRVTTYVVVVQFSHCHSTSCRRSTNAMVTEIAVPLGTAQQTSPQARIGKVLEGEEEAPQKRLKRLTTCIQ